MAELWEGDTDVSAFSLPGDPGIQTIEPAPEPEAAEQEVQEPESESEGRKRDEKGRFVPAQEPVEETPVVDQTPAERLYAGKYKSPEDLERAYEEIQQNHGRLADEVGQLRQVVEQGQPQYVPPQQIDRAGFDSLVEEDPASALEYAYSMGDQAALRVAANAWEDVSPGAPKLWAQNKALEMQLQTLHGNFTESAQAQEQQQTQQEVLRAWNTFKQTHPDAEDLRGEMFALVDNRPGVLSTLSANNFESKVQVFEDLYDLARARSSATLATAAQAAARSHVEETQRAKEEAIVASATASVPEAKLSAAQKIGQQWDALEAPFKDDWNV